MDNSPGYSQGNENKENQWYISIMKFANQPVGYLNGTSKRSMGVTTLCILNFATHLSWGLIFPTETSALSCREKDGDEDEEDPETSPDPSRDTWES